MNAAKFAESLCKAEPVQEPHMFNNTAQISELQKGQFDSLFALSQAFFNATERFVDLNLAAAKAVMAESAEHAQELLNVKDVQELIAVSNGFAQPGFDKFVAYSRNAYSIASEANAEVTQIVEAQIALGNKNLTKLIDDASKRAPNGSESAVSMLKSSLAAANTAYDSLNKATKQAVELVESNISAATNATLKTVNAANDSVKTKAKKTA
jgi:phasin family protein